MAYDTVASSSLEELLAEVLQAERSANEAEIAELKKLLEKRTGFIRAMKTFSSPEMQGVIDEALSKSKQEDSQRE